MKRRDFVKLAGMAGASTMVPWKFLGRKGLQAATAAMGLSDPAFQPKFVNYAPNALDPGFKYQGYRNTYRVAMASAWHETGLRKPDGSAAWTRIFGYGQGIGRFGTYTWPGKTFEVQSGERVKVLWSNNLVDWLGRPENHILPVDTSLHWAYSLHGYTQYSIERDGVPVVPHVHGGHTEWQSDGNPEYFFSPFFRVRGPRWLNPVYTYDNDQPAGTLWYHDHALGITRLNVYAGLAGFYIVRDHIDTGRPDNIANLPAFPYELAYAIQDRMFKEDGALFYPSFPGEPFYDDFITGEGATLPPALFPNGGPTALAEFFGDHIVVNGKIWPKTDVERRNYRLRLLNGTDSRFMVLRFRPVAAGATDLSNAGAALPFWVIGNDQGLGSGPRQVDTLVFEPGSRYDVVIDFSQVPMGTRIIMENLGGDAPFGGDYGDALAPEDFFTDRQTDRVMAFDVVVPKDNSVPDNFNPNVPGPYTGVVGTPSRVRKVALFEGKDEYGRLQPLQGVAEPTADAFGNVRNGSLAWHVPTTENPDLGATEIWEIWNATGDAHPIHLHLVHFDVVDRQWIKWDSNGLGGEEPIDPSEAAGDGTYKVMQPVLQHNGAQGIGFRLENLTLEPGAVTLGNEYVENGPKDMVVALPNQVTRIKMTFDRPGRYVWHCHILSHEDHEMMRVLHVGSGAQYDQASNPEAVAAVVGSFELEQNYPNPFNPSTTIRFNLPQTETVEMAIYNTLGQEVRTLVNQRYDAGQHSVVWDGRDNNGKRVSSGVYIYRIRAGHFVQSRRMNLVR